MKFSSKTAKHVVKLIVFDTNLLLMSLTIIRSPYCFLLLLMSVQYPEVVTCLSLSFFPRLISAIVCHCYWVQVLHVRILYNPGSIQLDNTTRDYFVQRDKTTMLILTHWTIYMHRRVWRGFWFRTLPVIQLKAFIDERCYQIMCL